MKKEDAAKILDIDGEITPEIVKKAYRVASHKYHPDKNPAGEKMMQAVNEAFETLKDFEGEVEQGVEGYGEALFEIIEQVLALYMVGVSVEVCGAWLWISGDTKPYAAKLGKKEGGLGLYFASKKKVWYYRPSDWVSMSRGSWSMDDIRTEHGSIQVTGQPKRTQLQ